MSATDKVSISIGRGELRHARRIASRLGLSLSTFITHAVRDRVADQDRREAAAAVLAGFAPADRASPEETAALLARWGGAGRAPVRAAAPSTMRGSRAPTSRKPAARSARRGGH